MNPEILHFDSSEALARAAAQSWLEQLAGVAGRHYTVGLSGGRIAGRFFSHMATLARADGRTMSEVEFFWADERCVPPTDPESNFALAQRSLLAPLHVPSARIHRIRGELEPALAATDATRELCQIAVGGNEGRPVLDMVFLGMGEDGHTASLFPEEPEAMASTPDVYRAVIASKPPPNRITLNYGPIAAARQVWVLASGAGKEKALRDSLSGTGTPLGRLLRSREQTRIFTDIR